MASIEHEINEPVHLVDYNPVWPQLFNEEKEHQIFIKRASVIEHFGSTSVSGMKAKPIIDILIGLPSMYLSKKELNALTRLGYKGFGEAGVPGRLYFVKRLPSIGYNLAVTQYSGKLWADNIMLRDYLRAHSAEAAKYALLKESIIASGTANRLLEYSQLKYDCVQDLLNKARQWQAKAEDR